jgi:hypothetical protein
MVARLSCKKVVTSISYRIEAETCKATRHTPALSRVWLEWAIEASSFSSRGTWTMYCSQALAAYDCRASGQPESRDILRHFLTFPGVLHA